MIYKTSDGEFIKTKSNAELEVFIYSLETRIKDRIAKLENVRSSLCDSSSGIESTSSAITALCVVLKDIEDLK